MKIELEVREMIHLLWSHGDAIPKSSSADIAGALWQKLTTDQIKMECKIFLRNYYGNITENQVDNEGGKLYNKIKGYTPITESMSKYTDLAKG